MRESHTTELLRIFLPIKPATLRELMDLAEDCFPNADVRAAVEGDDDRDYISIAEEWSISADEEGTA